MGNGGAFAAMAFVLGLMLVFIALAGRLSATVAAVTAPQLLVPIANSGASNPFNSGASSGTTQKGNGSVLNKIPSNQTRLMGGRN